jgi:hypothetical protein
MRQQRSCNGELGWDQVRSRLGTVLGLVQLKVVRAGQLGKHDLQGQQQQQQGQGQQQHGSAEALGWRRQLCVARWA